MELRLSCTNPSIWGPSLQGLWAPNPNLVKVMLLLPENNYPISSQLCTCHDSRVVVTCTSLWPDWIIRIIIRAKRSFTKFYLWTHQPFRKYYQISNISHTTFQNLNVSRPILHVCPIHSSQVSIQELRCSWSREHGRAMLQLHLSDQQVYCLIRCALH